MAALINALDNYTPTQIGENGHVEYGWANNIKDKIVQFSFQLTRTDDNGVERLKTVLHSLLTSLQTRDGAAEYLSVLYKMIGHTRDIVDGKGEYALTYMMIYTWYEFYPDLALFALKCLVDLGDSTVHQYGSWKDIKYFCEYCKSQNKTIDHPLIQYAIKLTNEQLKKDITSNADTISLAAKWVPREKSSFGWLYTALATNYFSEFLKTATNYYQQTKALTKCKTQYRKMLSMLNNKIDTLQIKQCGKDWSSIDFNKVTSISLSRQKKALLNIKKNGTVRHEDDEDRIKCADNFKEHIQKAVKGEIEIKGQRVGMADFTKQALEILSYNRNCKHPNENEANLLNSQWRDNATSTGSLGKMIAMVDVSGSMEGDPMNVAIALGIRIAEKSSLGKRIMTFDAKPRWVNLDGYNNFISQVEVVAKSPWGTTTNFHAALDLILDAIVKNKMSPSEVKDMILVVLSDMQMNAGDSCDKQVLYDSMKTKYANAGMKVCGEPYLPPHILFWNLRSTSGFPALTEQPNVSMLSGFSPSLLNLFCEQGLEALESCTPWALLERSLENDRYTIMSEYLHNLFHKLF
jgi:hypothetical protein